MPAAREHRREGAVEVDADQEARVLRHHLRGGGAAHRVADDTRVLDIQVANQRRRRFHLREAAELVEHEAADRRRGGRMCIHLVEVAVEQAGERVRVGRQLSLRLEVGYRRPGRLRWVPRLGHNLTSVLRVISEDLCALRIGPVEDGAAHQVLPSRSR